MISVIQRVRRASVSVNENIVGEIGEGLLALVAVEQDDSEKQCRRMAERLLGYRVFPDEQDRMNHSLLTTGKSLLLVPQFTLAADTSQGNRPSFTPAAEPAVASQLFNYLLAEISRSIPVQSGVFAADMLVSLENDGPVTFILQA